MTTGSVPAPHPFLAGVARALLEKADRSRGEANVRLRLDPKVAPQLHGASDGEALRLCEMLLQELAASGWVHLILAKAREFQSFTDRNPTLELLDFASLADWAGYESRHAAWDRKFLAFLRATPETFFNANRTALFDYLGRSPLWALEGIEFSQAVSCLLELSELCMSGVSLPLREASARIFQGRSKVLDSRQELLRLLGAKGDQFTEPPIQLLVAMPDRFDHVLFVENLVTFERMADHRHPTWARAVLAYAAGFKGSARRLRSPKGSRLYLRAKEQGDAAETGEAVAAWLYGRSELPVHFFGDLDYSGLQILSGIREGFSGAQAWQPGYARLAEVLRAGGGHLPETADKEGQAEPGPVGCAYADDVLLPLIRSTGRFVDQEAVALAQ
jgi:hypothetical protein